VKSNLFSSLFFFGHISKVKVIGIVVSVISVRISAVGLENEISSRSYKLKYNRDNYRSVLSCGEARTAK
jgi:hypothetical protein